MPAPTYSDPNFPSFRLWTAGLSDANSAALYVFYEGWNSYLQTALRRTVLSASNSDLAELDGSSGNALDGFYSTTPTVPVLPGGGAAPSENPYPQYVSDAELVAALAGRPTAADLTAVTAGLAGKLDAAKMPVLVKGFATGDGTTDDRAQILAAEAFAVLTGRPLDFGGPENVYAISDKLTLTTGRRWFGRGATVKPLASFPASSVVEITGTGGSSLTGIRIDGNKAVATSANALIASASNGDGFTIDVTLVNGRTYGMQIGGASSKNWDIKVKGSGCNSGVISFQGTGASDILIHDCQIKDTGAHGIQFAGTTPGQYQDVVITGCRIAIGGTAVGQIPVELNYIQGLVLSDNVVSGAGLRGFSLGGLTDAAVTGNTIRGQSTYGIELNKLTRTVVSGNTIYDCDSGMVGESCVDLLVEDNLIHTTHAAAVNAYGVFIQPTTATIQRVTVRGNRFVDVALHGVRITGAAEDVVVEDNQFDTTAGATLVSGNDPIAVSIGAWVRGTVQGNVITTALAGSGGGTVGMIYVIAACVDVQIKRNTVRGVGGSPLAKAGIAIAAVAAAGVRITNNDISNLTDGIRTTLNTADDTVIEANRPIGVTTPYTLKPAHQRSTVGWYEGTGSPEAAVTAPAPSVYVQKDGAAGAVVWVKTSGTGNTGWTPAGSSASVQTFTASGTWTKPSGYSTAVAVVVGGGGAGGGGREGAAGSVRSGGAGGGGASRAVRTMPISALGATVAVTVGAAGAAGAAAAANDTNGGAGGAGGTSAFGTHLQAAGGGGGGGGNTGAAAAGAAGSGQLAGGAGAASSATGAAGTSGASSFDGGSGGGAGGGITTADAASAGGAGAVPLASGFAVAAAGASGGGAGNAGAATPIGEGLGGPSGSGGGSSTTGAGGAGGAGAIYGGGGGGGGASVNGSNSGAGGAGGAALVIVIAQ